MKEYRSHQIENLFPLAVIRDWIKIYFLEMEKLLPVEMIFEKFERNAAISQKISFH